MLLTSGSPKIQISSLTSRRKPDQRNPIKENNAIVSKDDPLLFMRDNNPLMSITSGCAVYQTRSSMGGGGGGGKGGALNKVLYGEAPPRGPNPYPFIYNF